MCADFNSYVLELMKLNNNYNNQILLSPTYTDDSNKKDIQKYYYKSLIKLINKDSKFDKIKKNVESRKGKKQIYKLLKKYLQKYDSNWTEMKDIDNYDHVMNYLKKNILGN
jgi:hypothetical protein